MAKEQETKIARQQEVDKQVKAQLASLKGKESPIKAH